MREDVNLCRSVNYPVTPGKEHCSSNVCRATNDSFILRSVRPLVNFDCFSSRELMPRRHSTLKATEKSILDARAQAVLAAVIKEHLVTGEAVGSLVLAERFSKVTGWSSATIRNVMAELEEAGLVEQPHTSAGRVPTDQGLPLLRRPYAWRSAALSRSDLRAIDTVFTPSSVDAATSPDRLMEKMSHALSELSQNVGIVVSPSLAENRLNHIEFRSALRQTNTGRPSYHLKHHSQQDYPARRQFDAG